MRLVEDSYYEHEDHGRVKLVSVDATKVAFQLVNRRHGLPGGHEILQGKYEGVTEFKQKAEPADITVIADPIVIDTRGTSPRVS